MSVPPKSSCPNRAATPDKALFEASRSVAPSLRRRSRKRLAISMLTVVSVIAAFLAASAGAQVGSTLIVNSTGDTFDANLGDGVCSTGGANSEGATECTLIAAIQESNAAGPLDEINFDIPVSDPSYAAGVWTIQTAGAYPQVIAPVLIDGRTQPGWTDAPVVEVDGSFSSVNGLIFPAPAEGSSILGLGWVNFTETPLVVGSNNTEVAYNYFGLHNDGVSAGPNLNGLVLSNSEGANVHDNVMSGNTQSGMVLNGAGTTMNSIDGNLIGTTADGTAALGNGPAGISMVDASENFIGRAAGNIISGNGGDGVVLRNSDSNIFENNLIGMIADGTPMPNGWAGMMFMFLSSNNTVGAIGAPNTIVASGREGIAFENSSQNTVEGNYIGTDSAGRTGLGNTRDGIRMSLANGSVHVLSNAIAYNGQNGVAVGSDTTQPMTILNNTFVGNNGLAIDLNDDGVTMNDAGDSDSGANDLVNYPEIVSTTPSGAGVQVTFELSAPAGFYMVTIHGNPSGPDPTSYGEGEVLLESVVVNHPGGVEQHSTSAPILASAGDVISALATEVDSPVEILGGPTSEFGPNFVVGFAPNTVNSTGDAADLSPGDGVCTTGGTNSAGAVECTLRAAIEETNADPAVSEIAFDMPVSEPGHSAGTWQIAPSLTLPAVSTETTIDGHTQPGWTQTPVIEIAGSATAGSGLDIRGDNSVVRGLSIVSFPGNAIEVQATSGVEISDNYLGLAADGTTAGGNARSGLLIKDSANTTVERNVVGANLGNGVEIVNSTVTVVDDNLVGVDATGISPVGNGQSGVLVGGNASQTTIGTFQVGNTLSGNLGNGVTIDGPTSLASNTTLSSNKVGVGSDGTTPIPNAGHGISIISSAASTAIRQSLIGHNTLDGISVEAGVVGTVGIPQNTIFANGGLGIDLGNDGPTLNDPGDGDSGPNNLVNYPVVLSSSPGGGTGQFDIEYELDVVAGAYVVEIYSNPSGDDPSGFGEGEVLAALHTVDHPGGVATYTKTAAVNSGDRVSARLWRNGQVGNRSSEFGPQFAVGGAQPDVNSTDDDPDSFPGDGICDTGQLNSEGVTECTLRAALAEANADVDATAIVFNIPVADSGHVAGVWTINPQTALPPISSELILDGATQPGTGASPSIDIAGPAGGSNGLIVSTAGANTEIRNLAIGGFNGDGIEVSANNVTITGNYIGLAPDGVTPNPNAQNGVNVLGNVANVQIGGPTAADRNVISDNSLHGIFVADATGTTIRNNTIRNNTSNGISVAANVNYVAAFDNLIFDNDGLAIDLGDDGVSLNDAGDGDGGLNDGLNYPVATSVSPTGVVSYTVDAPSATYQVYLYDNPSGADPTGFGEAEELVWTGAVVHPGGSATYTTPALPVTPTSALSMLMTTTAGATAGTNSELGPYIPASPTNRPPVLVNPGPQQNAEGNTISLQLAATDPDGDTLTWTASNLPTGLAINSATGEITNTLGFTSAGNYTSIITVTDGLSPVAITFPWVVNNSNLAPVLSVPGSQTNAEGDTVSLPLVATDIDGDPLSWSATSLPPGLTINPATGEITGTTSMTSSGTHTPSISVTDNVNGPVTVALTWVITNTNQPPTIAPQVLVSELEGQSLVVNLTGTDPDGDTLTWSATGLPPGITIDPTTGAITGPLSFSSGGSYPVVVTASDGSSTATESFTIVVYNTNRPPILGPIAAQTNLTGDLVSLQPTATDPDGDVVSYSATGLPAGLSIDGVTGAISGVPSSAQTAIVQVTTTDPFADTSTQVFTWTVSVATTETTSSTTTSTSTTSTTSTTTTSSTTTAPPATTGSTTAPTTTTTAPSTSTSTTAPTTTTTAPPTTEAEAAVPPAPTSNPPLPVPPPPVPPSTVPQALPFVQVSALDDRVGAPQDQISVPVLDNDSFGDGARIVSVSEPSGGSVEIVGDNIVVSLPPSFAGDITFDYTISDKSGVESTASVTVFSVNVLAPAGELITQEQDTIQSISEIFGRATTLFSGLISIRLSKIQLGALALAPLVFGLVRFLVVRREDLVSLTNTPRTRSVDVGADTGLFKLRHDALVWSTRKTRKCADGTSKTQVELPNGQTSWVDTALVADTGF